MLHSEHRLRRDLKVLLRCVARVFGFGPIVNHTEWRVCVVFRRHMGDFDRLSVILLPTTHAFNLSRLVLSSGLWASPNKSQGGRMEGALILRGGRQ